MHFNVFRNYNFEYEEMNYYGFMVSEGITINFPTK